MRTEAELAKLTAAESMAIFLRNFSKVPEDKLTWSPAPTAKSAIRIAAHAALYFSRFAEMIRTKKLPEVADLDEWLRLRNTEEEAVTTREAVEGAFRAGLEEVRAAIDQLTPEEIASELDSGQGWTMSMSFLIRLPGWHTTLHCGQIDLLQTCWGDQEIYVG